MDDDALRGTLAFLRAAERMKVMTRTAWTSGGHRESVAEHTWRLTLMALVLGRELGGIDLARLLEICIIHDLGEAIGGDISAKHQPEGGKAESERRDLLRLLEPLPDATRARITALWDEYEAAATPEARAAKALDKLETILQHNQGANPADFDYAFNLGYGRDLTTAPPLIAAVRALLDEETRRRADESRQAPGPRLEQRLSLVTLGVTDLEASLRFYRDGLGWTPASTGGGDVAFFQLNGIILGLYARTALAADAGVDALESGGLTRTALAHNVRERDDVDRVLQAARDAGARINKPAEDAFWGGRSGYFADPDGFLWEVAWNPGFPIAPDGSVTIPE